MKKNSAIAIFIKCALVILCLPSVAYAETDNTKNALAKAQYMLRQISTEKANLEKVIAKQKTEIDALSKEMQILKLQSKTRLDANNSSQQEMVSALKGDRQKVQAKLESESEKNLVLSTANDELTQKLAKQANRFDICYDNNKKLYDINHEILGKYEEKGFWAALSQKEPFTAIERVKIENLVQDYQYQLDNLTVKIVSDEKAY